MFGTFDTPGVREFLGEITPEIEVLSRRMQDASVGFARSGLADWPACAGATRPTMVFDQACHVADDSARPMRDLWARAGG